MEKLQAGNSKKLFWSIFGAPGVWLIVFFIIPLTIVWGYSFGEKRNIVEIAITGTFSNYARALEPLYLGIFAKSLLYAGFTTVACLIVGFPVAMLVAFAPTRIKSFLLLLIILPFWTNLLIRTYALIAVLRQNGFVNASLRWVWEKSNAILSSLNMPLGGKFEPLELLYNNFAVVFGLVYVHLPFMVLPLYAALDRLDRSYLEASMDLGAGQWRTFWSVMLPMAMPGIISGIIITFIPALGSYLTPALLGGTDSQMIANVIESQFKSANNWPFGSALSFILMYVTFFILAARSLKRSRS